MKSFNAIVDAGYGEVFIPLNICNTHWVSITIDFYKKTITYIDHLSEVEPSKSAKHIQVLLDKYPVLKTYEVETSNNNIRQTNTYDCGMFVIMDYLKFLHKEASYTQDHVSEMRNIMVKIATFKRLTSTVHYQVGHSTSQDLSKIIPVAV